MEVAYCLHCCKETPTFLNLWVCVEHYFWGEKKKVFDISDCHWMSGSGLDDLRTWFGHLSRRLNTCPVEVWWTEGHGFSRNTQRHANSGEAVRTWWFLWRATAGGSICGPSISSDEMAVWGQMLTAHIPWFFLRVGYSRIFCRRAADKASIFSIALAVS